jgi:hypothetical protein
VKQVVGNWLGTKGQMELLIVGRKENEKKKTV